MGVGQIKDVCMKDARCFSKMEEQILSIRDRREHIRYKRFIWVLRQVEARMKLHNKDPTCLGKFFGIYSKNF